ncbi:MAG: uncharacterized ferritin-like protein (DUF455 family) [Planctomycetota bacterium]|jgi:uncharacterized ferritin-like protein (DUF455 family)
MAAVEGLRPCRAWQLGVPNSSLQAPPIGSIEAWAWDVIHDEDLERKLNPPKVPSRFAASFSACRPTQPSRPSPLRVEPRSQKTPRPGALVRVEPRAKILHVFMHHELQAAEIFCWALLAFPDAPESFRRGLLKIALDELRHARSYRAQVNRLGFKLGDFPVRDWFWQCFAACNTPLEFVAMMGVGFEGGNLDHCALWTQRFRDVGDEEGALCQEVIERDEIEHVAFAVSWFRRFHGSFDFESWRHELRGTVTPTVMRGKPMNPEARKVAGFDEEFMRELTAWDRK